MRPNDVTDYATRLGLDGSALDILCRRMKSR
jgi:hypothetical protein